ncbi:MAG: T9SS type A sorting domain-containing protein [bacterium]
MKTFKNFLIGLVGLIGLLFVVYPTQANKIHIQLPSINQNYCENLSLPDTFIVHKPLAFGVTNWYINSIPTISGDTIVYMPTTTGVIDISSTWNSNWEGFLLNIYSAPPSHVLFQINNGGTFSTNHDTVWRCSPTLNMTASGGTVGYAYRLWTGPGFTSTSTQVALTASGLYIHERGNSCGVTRDSFQLVGLPNVLPTLGPLDTTFCNVTVNLTLDPGPGWHYAWTGGSTSQTLSVTDTGTYTVNLQNACLTGSKTIHIHRQVYPIPSMNHMVGPPLCADSIVTLDPSPGYTYDSYTWSTGAHTSSIQISGLTTGGGMFTVTVTKGACTATAYDGFYQFYQPPTKPEICIVTVDSVTQKNMVVWTKDAEPVVGSTTYSPVASYNIYRDGGVTSIGTVNVHTQHTFVDMSSNPPLQSATYRIVAVDECGVESSKSLYHQTILLQTSQGSNPGQVNLTWNQYQDESGNSHIPDYDIYRGSSMNTLAFYKNVPAPTNPNLPVLIVDTVSSQQYYQIVANKPGGCDPTPNAKGSSNPKSLFATVRSNIKQGTSVGIYEPNIPNFSLYPNPSTGIYHIEGVTISRVEIMDALGKVIFTTNNQTIDLGSFASGIYYARIYVNGGSTNRKLIKQ